GGGRAPRPGGPGGCSTPATCGWRGRCGTASSAAPAASPSWSTPGTARARTCARSPGATSGGKSTMPPPSSPPARAGPGAAPGGRVPWAGRPVRRCWGPAGKLLARTPLGPAGKPLRVDLAANGSLAVAVEEGRLRLVDPLTGQARILQVPGGRVGPVFVAP